MLAAQRCPFYAPPRPHAPRQAVPSTGDPLRNPHCTPCSKRARSRSPHTAATAVITVGRLVERQISRGRLLVGDGAFRPEAKSAALGLL